MREQPSRMTVYCTYCGKDFTRKEHLERHIPQHTNVKPHRCSHCQLSFARRDLLQRHYTTYHEARDPMEPLPGGVPPVAGRTPIACQNCASAKTGCDKKDPCTRCIEKNLQCTARYARRSTKAAMRAAQFNAQVNAQANAAFQSALPEPPQQGQAPLGASLSFMDVSQTGLKSEGNGSPSAIEVAMPGDPSGPKSSRRTTPHWSQLMGDFPSPLARMDGGSDDLHPLGSNWAVSDFTHAYQSPFSWPDIDIHMDLDNYPNSEALARTGMSMSGFADFSSSPSSELVTAAPSSLSRGSTHTPGTNIVSTEFNNAQKPVDFAMSIPTGDSMPEFDVVLAAEGAWNLAQCNPATLTTANCPRTAIVHLECLEQKSKQEGTWRSLERYLERIDRDASDRTSVVPLSPRTRDKMLAITQNFLRTALEVHRGGVNGYPKSGYPSPGNFNFIVLPPSKILEYFLRSYVRSLTVYYPLVTAGCVDPNEMLQDHQTPTTLLLLLMIAQGAASMPMAEARSLSAGLTETCRISLLDIMEKDVELSTDPTALRCALLFLVLGAWSGDKWLMDIAMGQRSMYMSMLKNAGMLKPQLSVLPSYDDLTSIELQWRAWRERETLNRLVYNYVMLDQELCLFYDTAPLFAISDLHCPLPAPEVFWTAANSEEWFTAMQSLHNFTSNVNPQLLGTPSASPSLNELFRDFFHDNLLQRQPNLSPQQLRLLLHPVQALVWGLREMLSVSPACASGFGSSLTRSSILQRREEVHTLLQKWYDITMSWNNASSCPATRCNLVLYHLISLDTVTDFLEIERFARREGSSGPSPSELHGRCIFQRQKALFHCGQVFRLLRQMPADRRPAWWSAAVYRATMVLWMDSVVTKMQDKAENHGGGGGHDDTDNRSTNNVPVVMIDQLAPEDPALVAYLWTDGAVPMLTLPDGTATVTLDRPGEVLAYAVKNIETCFGSRIGNGIKRKLVALGSNWGLDVPGVVGASTPGGVVG